MAEYIISLISVMMNCCQEDDTYFPVKIFWYPKLQKFLDSISCIVNDLKEDV